MKIVIGSDRSGFKLKEAIKAHLEATEYDLLDIGTVVPDNAVAFFEVASEAAQLIQKEKAERAILICGTGMGMSQVANKYKGIRAACVESLYAAVKCRSINDSNILCMGGWLIGEEMGIEISERFLLTEFAQDLESWRQRHLENAKKEIAALENQIYSVK